MSAFVQGVDTNILVRLVTQDEPSQFAQAIALIASAEPGELYVDPLVLVELNWTLRRVYRLAQKEVLGVVEQLTETREFTVGQRTIVRTALSAAQTTGCDFSDAMIALLHEAAGCGSTYTFDVRAQRLEQMRPVPEVPA